MQGGKRMKPEKIEIKISEVYEKMIDKLKLMTSEKASQLTGISQFTLINYKNKKEVPSYATILKIAKSLKIT